MKKLSMILVLVSVLLLAAPVAACPNCKDSIATPVDTQQASAAEGFNRAIAVMLGASALGVAGLGAMFLVAKPRR